MQKPSGSGEKRCASTYLSRPDLSSSPKLKAFATRHGFSPSKARGQHWLISSSVVSKIIEACGTPGGILEIGPGPGILTQKLIKLAPTIALDVDPRSSAALAESAPEAEGLVGDVLKADLGRILARLKPPRAVVSNLPYYISSAVISRICERSGELERAVLMMQREVAERISAVPGDSRRGSLSVYVQLHFDVSTLCAVPPESFLPRPKVDSSVLVMRSRKRETAERDPKLLNLIRDGFKQPRKTLANNLISAGIGDRQQIESALTESEINPRVRPHSLTEEEWIRLADRVP